VFLHLAFNFGERHPCSAANIRAGSRSVERPGRQGQVDSHIVLSRARELAALYLKAPEVTRRNTRVHFIQPLKERIVREVGYGLSLEGAPAADLVKSMHAKSELAARKGKSA
jgi:hypothetical protein